ncbi:MAG: PAS domain-containing sensor histidine kinase [Desulfuromonas sp.]|nr:MAG: PAS domain-containing sensor histidine kinase [Desulfuromonas sp.]
MKITLQKRILLFSLLTLTLTIGVNTGFDIETFRRDYRDSIILRCKTLAEGLKLSIENVLALGLPLPGLEGVDERCKGLVATDPEIAYCLVEDSKGKPLYASNPEYAYSNVIELVTSLNELTTLVVFKPNQSAFYDVALNLHAADGRLAGRIHIGFSEDVLSGRVTGILQRSVLVLIIGFSVVFGLIFLFSRHYLVLPIKRLQDMAQKIAEGEFQVEVPELSSREFSELGGALREMAISLEERDRKIKEGYRDLRRANEELQSSHVDLENIGGELGRSREMYRSLMEDASDAILVSDEEDRIVLLNKVCEPFFGIARDEVVGNNLFSFFEKLQVEEIESLYDLHQAVLKGESQETEFRFVRKSDGVPTIGWLRASAVTGGDGKRNVQSIVRDVTQEHEVLENLEQSAQELKRLNLMKDSFLGVASHELKTPLTVILGYTELLTTEWNDTISPEMAGIVKHISSSAERLSTIVRDMVDVSMLEYKRLQMQKTPGDLNSLVHNAIGELQYFFHRRNQKISLQLEEGLPLLLCDGERIEQIIGNLVGNAVKFTPDGGTITVTTRSRRSCRVPHIPSHDGRSDLEPVDTDQYGYVELVVADNGIGIDPVDQLNVFDKFYEIGNIEEHFTGKSAFKGKGTGLGLTIVRGITQMHGGEIWVESPGFNPAGGTGASFHVLLPVDFDEAGELNIV